MDGLRSQKSKTVFVTSNCSMVAGNYGVCGAVQVFSLGLSVYSIIQ